MRVSLRVSTFLWMDSERRRELQEFIGGYRGTVDEIAFFTSFTHPPLPLAAIEERAAMLSGIIPPFRQAGFSVGINHLSTMGHLDENLEHSLREPYQHLVDITGSVSLSCYCASDPEFLEYVRAAYARLASAGPEFIWVDDDVRMEHHPAGVTWGCFCDRCLETFSRETGKEWTRESLRSAFSGGDREARLGVRRSWLEHNRTYLSDLLSGIRAAVDSVDPAIRLGLMTGEIAYSGCGFSRWASSLAGSQQVEVKWRPGGGFYTDEAPLGLLGKAHSIGRQVARLPAAMRDIQSEHENFPYQRIRKSNSIFVGEIAAYLGAGCTGTALNCMGIGPDPIEEYRPYFERVKRCRPFFDVLAATFGRSPCEGIWPAITPDHMAVLPADGDWPSPAGGWGGDLSAFGELAEVGLPMAYGSQGAVLEAVRGDGVLEFTPEEWLRKLAGCLMLDGAALERLSGMGLGEYTGFAVRERRDRDTTEVFTRDALNGAFAGWHRDCRPSFWPEPGFILEPTSPESRILSEAVDFAPRGLGPVSGIYENALGGRVAVLGYYPWRSLHSLAKTSQMKSLCRWLSHGRLPASVVSYHRAALWCRRDGRGRPAVLVVNASLDAVSDVEVAIRDVGSRLSVARMDSRGEAASRVRSDPPYEVFRLPKLQPWEFALLTAANPL